MSQYCLYLITLFIQSLGSWNVIRKKTKVRAFFIKLQGWMYLFQAGTIYCFSMRCKILDQDWKKNKGMISVDTVLCALSSIVHTNSFDHLWKPKRFFISKIISANFCYKHFTRKKTFNWWEIQKPQEYEGVIENITKKMAEAKNKQLLCRFHLVG